MTMHRIDPDAPETIEVAALIAADGATLLFEEMPDPHEIANHAQNLQCPIKAMWLTATVTDAELSFTYTGKAGQ